MKVSIIIPNYNGRKFLNNCLNSLITQTERNLEIIVVDNNSDDDSVEYIKNNYSNIKIICLDKNYGFSHAVNVGILSSCSEYIILLNNDVKCDKSFVSNLIKSIENKTNVFAVTSKIIQFNNHDKLDSAGDLYTILGWAVNRGQGRNINTYKKSCKIFSACAGAAIYKRNIFNKIGLFDEMYFAYLEDVDICYRAQIYGYNIYYEPNALVYHIGSGSSGSKYNEFKIKLSSRNSIYLNYKNMPYWQLILNILPLLTGYMIKYLFFKKIGYEKIYLKGLYEGIKTRHKLIRHTNMSTKNYFKIELKLIIGTFIYIYDWILRKIFKK